MENEAKKRRRKRHRAFYGEDYSIIRERKERKEYIPIADRHIDGA